ncbi:hypothetical protein RS694_15040 [Rhodoferax saidenbachensis]|uniref:HTH tetR-type domain-containing protein n=2 Tax=Rhodoferax saidenbachensis TaxID=1484693 RepID=A0A1P8KCG4_9BURK|nr:hypothetical protein RS694_15040 [Rhodoferax saidenbachensis]
MERKRARSQEDKDQRRAHLVAAAAELFAQGHYDTVTIARVADRAGVAKGTAYLYFASKETLFLELVRAELTQWLAALTASLGRVRSAQAADAVAKAIAHSLDERATLRRLLVLLHSVLELNIAEDTARSFKHFMRDLLHEVSTTIAQAIPGLRLEDAQTLVLQTHALVISVTQLSEPPAVVARVMEADPSLHSMRIAFEPFVAHTLTTLLRGMLHPRPVSPRKA